MIDNYDSFTYNLVRYFQELHAPIHVYRNDQLTVEAIDDLKPTGIIISPGPGRPTAAGITLQAIKHYAEQLPILGVCLGHQALGEVFGARVTHAHKIMHGKTSLICHNNTGIFRNLPNNFRATRYHSLVIDPKSLSAEFEISAWTEDDAGNLEAIMGIEHRRLPLYGVQFHPESVLTEHGHRLLQNFLDVVSQGRHHLAMPRHDCLDHAR